MSLSCPHCAVYTVSAEIDYVLVSVHWVTHPSIPPHSGPIVIRCVCASYTPAVIANVVVVSVHVGRVQA